MIKSIKYFKLGLEMIKESLESMDQMLQEVPFVRKTGL